MHVNVYIMCVHVHVWVFYIKRVKLLRFLIDVSPGGGVSNASSAPRSPLVGAGTWGPYSPGFDVQREPSFVGSFGALGVGAVSVLCAL